MDSRPHRTAAAGGTAHDSYTTIQILVYGSSALRRRVYRFAAVCPNQPSPSVRAQASCSLLSRNLTVTALGCALIPMQLAVAVGLAPLGLPRVPPSCSRSRTQRAESVTCARGSGTAVQQQPLFWAAQQAPDLPHPYVNHAKTAYSYFLCNKVMFDSLPNFLYFI